MKLIDAYAKLTSSNHPIAVNLLKESKSKVFVMFFKKGMALQDHKTILPAVLYVIAGSVQFSFNQETKIMQQFDEILIPTGAIHNVICIEDATCLLIQN